MTIQSVTSEDPEKFNNTGCYVSLYDNGTMRLLMLARIYQIESLNCQIFHAFLICMAIPDIVVMGSGMKPGIIPT